MNTETPAPKSNANEAALRRLVDMAEEGRLERSEDRPCRFVEFDGRMWRGEIRGQGKAVWRPRITVFGKQRSFGCTCHDHKKQKGQVGPCKHVISLAKAGLEELELVALFDF